ncbi:MAG: (2Fe-2S)-binding protein [Pseudomonadota bacterium]
MYVCICNGHREGEIVEVARSGVRCALKAYDLLGGRPQCGQCLAFAQTLIDDIHGETTVSSIAFHTTTSATA